MFIFPQATTVEFIDELQFFDPAQWDRKPSYVCIEEPKMYDVGQFFNTNTVTLSMPKDVTNNVFERALHYIQDMGFLDVNEEHDRLVSKTVSEIITSNLSIRTLDKNAFYSKK